MAGRKLMDRTKVRASSLLEVLIAMIIILLVFSIAMAIFTNVMKLSLSAKKIKAQAILQETMLQAEQLKSPVTQTLTIDSLEIKQEVMPYESNSKLTEIDLTAFDENRQKLAELHKVFLNK